MSELQTAAVGGVEPGMRVEDVPTPALLVDIDRMEANIAEFQRYIAAQGKKLRPHIKTHKIPEIALLQEQFGACGIAAAKPTEAEVFVDAGCRDIVLAFPGEQDLGWGVEDEDEVGFGDRMTEDPASEARLRAPA